MEARKGYLFETDEHRALREQIRRFAANAIAPNAHAWEEANEFPRELYQTAAKAGFLGIGYPEELGGNGGDLTHVLCAPKRWCLPGSRSALSWAWVASGSRFLRS